MAASDHLGQLMAGSGRAATRDREARLVAAPASLLGAIWAGLDCCSVVLAGLIAFRIRVEHATGPGWMERPHAMTLPPGVLLLYLLLYSFYLVVFARSYGLYRPTDKRSLLNEQRLTAQACSTAGLLLCGTLYLLRAYAVSRIVMALTVVITMGLVMLRRAAWRKLRERRFREGLDTLNILIVGNGRVGHALRSHLETLGHMGYRFKGFVTMRESDSDCGDPDYGDPDCGDPDSDDGMVVGHLRTCVARARSLFVDEIFFSTPVDKEILLPIVEEARSMGIAVRVVPDLYDGLAWNAPVEYVGQFPTIPLHQGGLPRESFVLKRGLDVLVATVALLAVSPLLLGIAAAVRLDSPGPILYRADRLGRKGRLFGCYKFRTMVPEADRMRGDLQHMNEREGVLFKIRQDPRLTRLGRWLRKYSLDELPQILNVLKGDMSLVGPRPPLASEVQQYDLMQLRRLDVLPGMTGLWQVEARQDPSFANYISLDTAYVENWSLRGDLRILARTVGVVFSGTGS